MQITQTHLLPFKTAESSCKTESADLKISQSWKNYFSKQSSKIGLSHFLPIIGFYLFYMLIFW